MPFTSPGSIYPTAGARVIAPMMLQVQPSSYTSADQAPVTAIESPSAGANLARNASHLVRMSASDPDGTISTVELLVDGALAVNASPQPASFNPESGYYETTLTIGAGALLGAHTLASRATDNAGNVTTSATRSINVVAATNQPPTVSIVYPADGGPSLTAGQPYVFQIAAADPDGSIANVTIEYDGNGTLLPTTYNAVSGYYERTVTFASNGSRTLRARATDNSGAVTASEVRNFTIGATAPTLDPVVQAYVTATGVESAEAAVWNEFYARLKNRDSEFSADLTPLLADAFCLRSAYNHGSGTTVRGLLGTTLTMSGSPLPAWQTDGMLWAGGTGVATSAAGILTGSASALIYGYASGTGNPSTTTYVAAQFENTVPGSLLLGRPSSSGTVHGVVASGRDNAAVLRTAFHPVGNYYGTTAKVGSAAGYSSATTRVRVVKLPGGENTETVHAALTTTVGEAVFRIGNSAAGTSGWIGTIAVVVALKSMVSDADAIALHTVVTQTIGAGA